MEQTRAQEIDTELAGLHEQGEKLAARRRQLMEHLHSCVDDMRTRAPGGDICWQLNDIQVVELAEQRLQHGRDSSLRPGPGATYRTLTEIQEINAGQARLAARIFELSRIYRSDPWNRYYLVTNTGGHVHKDMHCVSCFPATRYQWLVDLAAQPADEMIDAWGERACTFCFPDAPANPAFRAPGRRDREALDARAAERAAKEAGKWIKNLRPDEQFRVDSQRVETVAACVQVLRDEVEFRDYFGRGEHPDHAAYAEGALRATEVLLTREAAIPGTGKTREQIAQVVTRAIARNRRGGARI